MLKPTLRLNRIAHLVRTAGLLAVIVWLFLPTVAQTQYAPVDSRTENLGYDGGTTQAMDTTGATLLVACVSSHHPAPDPTIEDSKGNSWNLAASSTEFMDGDIWLFYAIATPTTVGSGHTFTVNGSAIMASISVTAWSGATPAPLDDIAGAGAAGTSIQPGAVSPTEDNELLITCLSNTDDFSNTSRSINGGFTISGQVGENTTTYAMSVAGAYLVQTTKTTANPTWSYPVNNTANAVIATFKTATGGGGGGLSSKPMLDWNTDVTTVGGFRTPIDPANEHSGRALAYHDNTLFLSVWEGAASKVLQMDIPVAQLTGDPTQMSHATRLQPVADITDGNMAELSPQTDYYRNWGLLVHEGKLIGSAYHFYDDDNSTRVSHFSHSLLLASSTFAGWMAVWDNLKTGFVSGPMAEIPEYAQAELSDLSSSPPVVAKVIATGAGRASIVSRLSFGHSAFAFDPSQIAGRTPFTIPAQELMYFTQTNPMQHNAENACGVAGPGGCANDPSEIWTRATSIGGVVIPTGTRTLLYFGTQGTGDYCYGAGTSIQSLHGQRIEPDNPQNTHHYCYDPANNNQGDHAYPYRPQIWAFDLKHLAEVRAGTRVPWDVPVQIWPLDFLVPTNDAHGPHRIGGVAYDATNKAIYVAQLYVDPDTYRYRPIIWKYTHQ